MIAAISAPGAAEAASFAGKYTGVLIISQGNDTRIVGSATVNAKANGQFVIKGTVNNVAFTQTIKLGPNKSASVSSLLPGVAGFTQGVSGQYGGKKNISINAPFSRTSPGGEPTPGTFQMKISKTTYNSTLSISTKVSFASGNPPVYVTIVAS